MRPTCITNLIGTHAPLGGEGLNLHLSGFRQKLPNAYKPATLNLQYLTVSIEIIYT